MPEEEGRSAEEVKKQIIESAIQTGIQYTIDRHPDFAERERYLDKQVNRSLIYGAAEEIMSSQEFAELGDGKKQAQYLHQGLLKIFEEGKAFQGPLEEIVAKRNDVQGKADDLGSRVYAAVGGKTPSRKEIARGDKRYATVFAAKDILTSMSPEDARRMPKLAEAAYRVANAGTNVLNVETARFYGLLDEKDYKAAIKATGETIDRGRQAIATNIIEYSGVQKAAAAVLAGTGLGVVFASGFGITGNIVGNVSDTSVGLFGGFLLLISMALFLTRNRE